MDYKDTHNKIELFLKYDELQKKVKSINAWTDEKTSLNIKKQELRLKLYNPSFVNYLNSCRINTEIADLGDNHIIVGENSSCDHKILLLRKKSYKPKKSKLRLFNSFDEIEQSKGTEYCALTKYCQTLDKLQEIETELELLRVVKDYVIQNDITRFENYEISIKKSPNGFKVRLK